MSLKTQRKINTLSDEVSIKGCKPQDIAIPKDVITNAKKKWKIIEKAYKDYGPGVINNLRSIGKTYDKGKTPIDNFIKEINSPYETLCFYESYFEGASNFKEIEKYFEKARKTLETAAKRSRPFKKALDDYDFVYKTDDVKELKYKENPDNNSDNKIPILKDQNKKPVFKFAFYCADVINSSYTNYEKAHKKFKEIKNKMIESLNNEQKRTFTLLKTASKEAHKAFNKDLFLLPKRIDQLYIKANTKVHRLQTKTYSSNDLDNLMKENEKLKNNITCMQGILSNISSFKFGDFANDTFEDNKLIYNVYKTANQLQDDLTSGKINYNLIQEELDHLIDITNVMAKRIAKLKTPTNKEIKFNRDTVNKINKTEEFTRSVKNVSIDISDKVERMNKIIDKFQESYTLKGWITWAGKKAIITLLTLAKTIDKILLNLTKYNEAFGFVKDIGKYVISDGDNPMFWEDD